jgi:hypothetical protein
MQQSFSLKNLVLVPQLPNLEMVVLSLSHQRGKKQTKDNKTK